jgi:hypothetical protein
MGCSPSAHREGPWEGVAWPPTPEMAAWCVTSLDVLSIFGGVGSSRAIPLTCHLLAVLFIGYITPGLCELDLPVCKITLLLNVIILLSHNLDNCLRSGC